MNEHRSETPPEPVDREQAFLHATLAIRREWAARVPGLEEWHDVELDPEPLVLLDLDGTQLFYEFTVRRGEEAVGSVKASASRLLGSGVVAFQVEPRRWDTEEAVKKATALARKRFPRTKIVGTSLVCYSYPKIGVRVDVADKNGGRSVIYDVSDLAEVTEFGADGREGFTAWSFYQEAAQPEAEKRLRRWELEERELETVRKQAKRALGSAFTAKEVPRMREQLTLVHDLIFVPFYSWQVLKYGPRCSPHDCFMLYAQQTDVYCAVATGQMILDFYRWPYTQDEIATAMNTGSGGTSNPDQVAGYETLTRNTMSATYDTSADWNEAKSEIDANRPVKSGISGHARACAGWKRQNIFLFGQQPRRWLQIYDPWPWNQDICSGGAVYWEDWDTITHTNFIYVRHRTTTCS